MCDRDLALTGLSKGRDILTAIKSSIPAQLLATYPAAEQIFIKLKLADISVLLSVAYFSPKLELTVQNSHLNSVQSLVALHNCDSFELLSDYNLPKVSWFSDPLHYLPLEYISPTSEAILRKLIIYS